MKSGVASSLSPNQNGSTSLRPRPAFATSRIFEPGSSAITGLIGTSSSWSDGWQRASRQRRPLHRAARRLFGLGRREIAHRAKPVARALIVVCNASLALAPHHADVQRLDELVVRRAHAAVVHAAEAGRLGIDLHAFER